MHQPGRKTRVSDTVMMSGWVFADLLLALAILFMAANTLGVKPPSTPKAHVPTPTPTPTITPTPTPKPEPALEQTAHRIILTNVDFNGLLNDSPQAVNDFKQRIRGQSFLTNRSVGITIGYAGAPTDNDISQADTIVNKFYGILQSLGQDGFAFQRSSYYDPLFVLQAPPTTIKIDVYLFKQ